MVTWLCEAWSVEISAAVRGGSSTHFSVFRCQNLPRAWAVQNQICTYVGFSSSFNYSNHFTTQVRIHPFTHTHTLMTQSRGYCKKLQTCLFNLYKTLWSASFLWLTEEQYWIWGKNFMLMLVAPYILFLKSTVWTLNSELFFTGKLH